MLLTISIIILCVLAEQVVRYVLREIITLSYNIGVGFGLLRDKPKVALFLSVFAFIVIILSSILAKLKPVKRIGLAIMAGGALSNLLERIVSGYIIDWLKLPLIDLRLNLADVEILLGALLIILS